MAAQAEGVEVSGPDVPRSRGRADLGCAGPRCAAAPRVRRAPARAARQARRQSIEQSRGDAFASGRWDEARSLVVEASLADEYPDFLTLPAYARMP